MDGMIDDAEDVERPCGFNVEFMHAFPHLCWLIAHEQPLPSASLNCPAMRANPSTLPPIPSTETTAAKSLEEGASTSASLISPPRALWLIPCACALVPTCSGGNDDDGMDSALKSIIPSSEREGTGLSSHGSHEWDTSELSDNDGWDKHSSSDDSDSDSSSDDGTNSAWLKQHSWESSKDAQLKADIKKMYHNGINKISKSIAKQADEENNNSFYSKWAGGKAPSALSGSKGSKTPLSNSDMKLYKEAESSVKKEEEKKAPLIKAVKSADSKDESSEKTGGAGASKNNHSKEVKAKLEAADRLSKHLAKKQHKTSVKDLLKQSARIAAESKKAHGKKAKAAVEANAKKLQEEIKEDFSHATAIADNIQSTANKLVGSKLKSSTQSV